MVRKCVRVVEKSNAQANLVGLRSTPYVKPQGKDHQTPEGQSPHPQSNLNQTLDIVNAREMSLTLNENEEERMRNAPQQTNNSAQTSRNKEFRNLSKSEDTGIITPT